MNTVELSDSGHPQIANMSWIADNHLVANVTIFFKWSPHNGHLSITENFFKIRRCPLFRGFTILTRLRLDLSHLCEHTFKHSFQDCLIPFCLCGNRTKTSIHYLLHCPTYTNERLTLLNKIKSINCNILESCNTIVTKFFYLVRILSVILLIIPSFWTQQLNTSYILKDLKAPL